MQEAFAQPILRTRRQDMIFQFEEAPLHWGLQVRAFFNDKFLERWIDKGGPPAWPRSLDINPLGFFLRGYVKTELFKTPVTSLQHLRDCITQAFAQVTVLMLDKTWNELLRRLKMLTNNGASHVKVSY